MPRWGGEEGLAWRVEGGLSHLVSSSTASSSLRRSICAPACSMSASSSLLLSRARSRDACERVGMSPHSRPSLSNLSMNWSRVALYSFPERCSQENFSARIPEVTALGEAPQELVNLKILFL